MNQTFNKDRKQIISNKDKDILKYMELVFGNIPVVFG